MNGYMKKPAIFTWSQGESLANWRHPERMAQIEREWEERRLRPARIKANEPLLFVYTRHLGEPEPAENEQACIVCSVLEGLP